MKNFSRILVTVVAIVLLVMSVYTCSIACCMAILSSQVADAELVADAGTYHDRESADVVYERVQEMRNKLYYGGGYKSFFSTAHRAVQAILLIVSVVIIAAEGFFFVIYLEVRKERKERARRAERARRIVR